MRLCCPASTCTETLTQQWYCAALPVTYSHPFTRAVRLPARWSGPNNSTLVWSCGSNTIESTCFNSVSDLTCIKLGNPTLRAVRLSLSAPCSATICKQCSVISLKCICAQVLIIHSVCICSCNIALPSACCVSASSSTIVCKVKLFGYSTVSRGRFH